MVNKTESPLNLDTRSFATSSNVFSFKIVSLYLNRISFQKDFLRFLFDIPLNNSVQR